MDSSHALSKIIFCLWIVCVMRSKIVLGLFFLMFVSCREDYQKVELTDDKLTNIFVNFVNSKRQDFFLTVTDPPSQNFLQILKFEKKTIEIVVNISTSYADGKKDVYVSESSALKLIDYLNQNNIHYALESDIDLLSKEVIKGDDFDLTSIHIFLQFEAKRIEETILSILNKSFSLNVLDFEELEIRKDELWIP